MSNQTPKEKSRGKALTKHQKAKARYLRKNMSDAERELWSHLRQARDAGVAFRRQVPIGPYVADFLCRKANLIIEVDGEQHAAPQQVEHDQKRDAYLRKQGYRILRIWTHDIWSDVNAVLDRIDGELRLADAL